MPVVFVTEEGKKSLPPRRANDFYPTDQFYADGCMQSLTDIRIPGRVKYILDAGAGNDPVFAKAARCLASPNIEPRLTAVEIRPEALPTNVEVYKPTANHPSSWIDEEGIRWYIHDYLKFNKVPHQSNGYVGYDMIVGNPPFMLAEEFINHSFELLRAGGLLSFLLPITFLGTQGRHKRLFDKRPPRRITFLSDRPSFTGDGQTAPNEYVLLTWVKPAFVGDERQQDTPRWLSIPTPPDIRKRNLEVRAARKAALLAQPPRVRIIPPPPDSNEDYSDGETTK